MITNPKDFFQQVQNLVEGVALKVKALGDSLSSFLTKADAEAIYLEKTEAANTYLGKNEKAASATVADSATSADKATKDANGYNISNTYLKATTAASTYLKQSDADSKYLGKTAKAESAKTADTATSATSAGTATKAIQDGDSNVISGTYLKSTTAEATYLSKTDASSTYLGKTAKAESAKVADRATTADSATTAVSATKATQDGNGNNIAQTYARKSEIPEVPEVDTSAFVVKTGGRGSLSGYEDAVQVSGTNSVTINQDSPDVSFGYRASEVTIENGATGTSWFKVYGLTMTAFSSVTLGTNWSWSGGSAPTFEGGGLLVMSWNGNSGIVNYIFDGLETQQGGQSGGID